MDRSQAKRNAAVEAVRMIEDGMTVGLGTGSTAAHVIELLGERVARGLGIRGVATSEATAAMARAAGIPLFGLEQVENVDVTIDGADEITADGSAIKGGGGALLREKVVAAVTRRLRIAVVDESKIVKRLGTFPLPVEVIPFARAAVSRAIQRLGGEPDWRHKDGAAVLTDNGNHLLDARFGTRSDGEWAEIARALEAMPGVVAHGLFLDCFDLILVGDQGGVTPHGIVRAEPGRFPRL